MKVLEEPEKIAFFVAKGAVSIVKKMINYLMKSRGETNWSDLLTDSLLVGLQYRNNCLMIWQVLQRIKNELGYRRQEL